MTNQETAGGLGFVILEDHKLVSELLERRVTSIFSGAFFPYCGASVSEAIEVIKTQEIAAVILDLDLGDGGYPLETIQTLVALQLPILVVSAAASPRIVQQALALGVSGYVSKQCPVEEFDAALMACMNGEPYVSRDLAGHLANSDAGFVSLSPQEVRTLVLYASGLKIEAVARQMGISRGTASEYIKRARQKYAQAGTNLPSKVDLYVKVKEEGLI
ncbi:MAG: DNA-binding response regulator [Actinobacteria bacterium]|nr:DNA-binding response regulator [Actinomycetota bacterium]